jgi:thioredoxin-related protein
MKRVILSFTICLFIISTAVAQNFAPESSSKVSLKWEKNFKKALSKAKKQNKPVLIYFTGSDWCSPCKVLDKKLFHTERFESMADESLILFKVDVPRNKDLINEKTRILNKEISEKYGQSVFPTMILVDGDGYMLDIKKGVYMTEYYYPFFEKVIAYY